MSLALTDAIERAPVDAQAAGRVVDLNGLHKRARRQRRGTHQPLVLLDLPRVRQRDLDGDVLVDRRLESQRQSVGTSARAVICKRSCFTGRLASGKDNTVSARCSSLPPRQVTVCADGLVAKGSAIVTDTDACSAALADRSPDTSASSAPSAKSLTCLRNVLIRFCSARTSVTFSATLSHCDFMLWPIVLRVGASLWCARDHERHRRL